MTETKKPQPKPKLTRRQMEVLTLTCQGLKGDEICESMKIAEGTLRHHRLGFLNALGAKTLMQAAFKAGALGLVKV